MKVVFKTRYPMPLYRMILLLILSLVSAYYFLQIPQPKALPVINASFMILSPIVPDFEPRNISEPFLTKTVEIAKNKTFMELMSAQGMAAETVQEIYDSTKQYYNLSRIQAGKKLVLTTRENEFYRLEYPIDPLQTLVISASEGTLRAEVLQRNLEIRVEELGSRIEDSLYSSVNALSEGDELVIGFADIFEWDVDFFKDLQEGDTFRIVYEKKYVEGESYGYGNILAAELTNKGRTLTAFGYKVGNKYAFFSPDGKPMRKAFLAAPLKFSRISSGFSRSRYHPILRTRRPHYGIDYAAPAGTPVRAIGSGRVILAGWAGGAGRTIKIQHNKEIASVYCHLSRFAKGIRKGSSVSQGQVIGYVGSTGLATGPHLDFRFLKNGRYVNFLSIKSPPADPLSKMELEKFQIATADVQQRLASVRLLGRPSEFASMHPAAVRPTETTF